MKNSRKKYVVDTNVPMTANMAGTRGDDPAGCTYKCAESIAKIKKEGVVILDDGDDVLSEYLKKLDPYSGQEGIGHEFVKWVHDHKYDSDKVCIVPLKPKQRSYHEYPNDSNLAKFDEDDHKFIALANACNKTPVILQATDGEWWKYKDAFKQAGIKICFLCPDVIEENYKQKYGKKQKTPKTSGRKAHRV